MGGGKGGTPSIKIGPMERLQADILRSTNKQLGEPLRGIITPQVLQTAGQGGIFSTSLPGVDRDVIEQQYKQARANILGNSPTRGGQLNSQLATLDRSRAFDVASAVNQAKQRGIERTAALIPGMIPGAQQLAGATGTEQQRQMANAQMQAQAQQGLGGGIGGLLGLK